jgi:hypothetical protein
MSSFYRAVLSAGDLDKMLIVLQMGSEMNERLQACMCGQQSLYASRFEQCTDRAPCLCPNSTVDLRILGEDTVICYMQLVHIQHNLRSGDWSSERLEQELRILRRSVELILPRVVSQGAKSRHYRLVNLTFRGWHNIVRDSGLQLQEWFWPVTYVRPAETPAKRARFEMLGYTMPSILPQPQEQPQAQAEQLPEQQQEPPQAQQQQQQQQPEPQPEPQPGPVPEQQASCVLCECVLDDNVHSMFVPCNCAFWCYACALKHWQKKPPKKPGQSRFPKCPTCRKSIKTRPVKIGRIRSARMPTVL